MTLGFFFFNGFLKELSKTEKCRDWNKRQSRQIKQQTDELEGIAKETIQNVHRRIKREHQREVQIYSECNETI